MSEDEIAELLDLIAEIKDEVRDGTPILVEGRRDIVALNRLGIQGEIMPVCGSGKRLIEIVDQLRGFPQVIILCDLDKEGSKLTRWLKRNLEESGVVPNLWYRNELRKLTKNRVKTIQELYNYIMKAEKNLKGRRLTIHSEI